MKNKGFTLIELLAVIVILAIIALIATPIILGVIEKARVGSAESSALGYIDAVEKQISINLLDKELVEIKEGTYTVEELENLGVRVKGKNPTGIDDYITIDQKNNITDGILTFDNYEVIIKNGKIEKTNKIEMEKYPIKKIEIKNKIEIIEVGKTLQLEVEITPENATNKNIKWSSSNKEVATISESGLITAIEAGTTTIEVQTNNRKKDTFELIVKPTPIALVPTMTSNTTPSGIASSSGHYSSSTAPYKAFVQTLNDDNDCWHSPSAKSAWISYNFQKRTMVTNFMTANRNVSNVAIWPLQTFTLQGSDDGITWTDIQAYESVNRNASQINEYIVNQPAYYNQYRIMAVYSKLTYTAIGRLQFYGYFE